MIDLTKGMPVYKKFLLDKWWVFALLFILFFSYWTRAAGNVPDRILSFDPTFFLRFTKYFADWGHFPVWDELSYYVGRADTRLASPLMEIITATVYNFFKSSYSIQTVASQMAAIFGALIVVPAFLLGRELSNKYGGIFAAALIGSAPQILTRTFGASYDTDQMALLFILFTLYAGFRCLRKKTTESAATAILVYSAAMLSWGDSMFTYVILAGYAVVLFFSQWLFEKSVEKEKRFSSAAENFKWNAVLLAVILAAVELVGILTNTYGAIGSILSIASFAHKAEIWIVNISIAELQLFNIFSLDGWMKATGSFVTGDAMIDISIFAMLVIFMFFGILYSYKKNINIATFMTAIFLIAFYVTTRGIRFTEFSSALFLTIAAAGFGYAFEYFSHKSIFLKSSIAGVVLILILFAFGISSQLGYSLGPDVDSNWDDAWKWIKNNTPEDSIIGTWWDPGHMISGVAERRNFADGAHCPNTCKYTINDRIVDLGKIMATDNETVSLELIKKYKGTSSKVYWIASDDLISKYQWLEYFGLGCSPSADPKNCAVYQPVPFQGEGKGTDGKVVLRNYQISNSQGNYQSLILFETQPKVTFYISNGNAYLLGETIWSDGVTFHNAELTGNSSAQAFELVSPLLKQMKMTPTNQTINTIVWFPENFGYALILPPNLANTVFTKMFLFDGYGLQNFTEVYKNNRVKIFEVST